MWYLDGPWKKRDSWLVTGDLLPQNKSQWNNPWLLTIVFPNSMAHLTIQGGAPKTAKLVYNSNFTRTYGRYIELVNGIINQQTPLGGHHLVSPITIRLGKLQPSRSALRQRWPRYGRRRPRTSPRSLMAGRVVCFPQLGCGLSLVYIIYI